MGEGRALDGYLGSRRTHPRGDCALSRRCGGSFMKSVLLARHSGRWRSEEHTSELQSLMRFSYAVFCLKQKAPVGTNGSAHSQSLLSNTSSVHHLMLQLL